MMPIYVKTPGLILTFILFLMAGCGGAPNENPNYLEQNGIGRSITVTLSGADGEVSISLGSRGVAFTEDGSQEVGGLPPSGDITATITASPQGQQCFFSPSNLTSIVAGSQVDVVCSAPGISGSVKDFFTGDEISGAAISVTQITSDGTESVFASSTSDASGLYSIADSIAGNRYILNVTASGYAPQAVIALPTTTRPAVIENVLLVPENGSQSLDPAADMVFSLNGITVLQVPANGLVDGDNNPPMGNVSARMTFLDPSSGATALPGRYEFSAAGSVNFIESFGGLAVVLTDAQGTALNLAAGVSAQLNIPVASRAIGNSPPTTASAYLFDADSGYWTGAVSASLGDQGGTAIYQSTVTTLATVFTTGQTYDTVLVSGCIEDNGGNGVASATIIAQGESYIGTAYAVSDNSGSFSVPAKADSQLFVYGLVGARSRTSSVSTSTSNTDLGSCLPFDFSSTVITLTWGETPSDLDSHLYGPIPDSSDRFHVYYVQTSVTVSDETIFLDVDDVTSFGPEITTIPDFPTPGVYEFFVDNFSGTPDIRNSPARVELNLQGESFTFSPPESGTPTRCWHVFDITVDTSLNGIVNPVSEWIDDRSVCTSTGLAPPSGAQSPPMLRKPSPTRQAIESKYYAP